MSLDYCETTDSQRPAYRAEMYATAMGALSLSMYTRCVCI